MMQYNLFYTVEELNKMTVSQLVELGVVAKVIGGELSDIDPYDSPFNQACRMEYIQSMPMNIPRFMSEISSAGGSFNDILERAMKISGGKLNPIDVKNGLMKT